MMSCFTGPWATIPEQDHAIAKIAVSSEEKSTDLCAEIQRAENKHEPRI